MNTCTDRLMERIEQFRKNLKDYKSKNYDEYKTRADFIVVMFASLGWDMPASSSWERPYGFHVRRNSATPWR